MKMGYRSDVTVLIYGDTKDVVAFVAGEKLQGKPKNSDFHPLSEPTNETHERNTYTYGKHDEFTMMEFNWWDVKWYDSYPEVDYWTNLESVWDEAFPRLSMEVARVGESVDDNVTSYYGSDPQYHLNINREISKDMP
jgi:hypothetical protein